MKQRTLSQKPDIYFKQDQSLRMLSYRAGQQSFEF